MRKDDPTPSSPTKPQNVHKLAEVLVITEYHITKHFTIPVEINGVINVKAMLDTGATTNFIHQELVDQHGCYELRFLVLSRCDDQL
jgi:predicted aspartyl protease